MSLHHFIYKDMLYDSIKLKNEQKDLKFL